MPIQNTSKLLHIDFVQALFGKAFLFDIKNTHKIYSVSDKKLQLPSRPNPGMNPDKLDILAMN